MRKTLLLALALVAALALPGIAQLPQTQEEFWRQADERIRQQEQERWARDITDQAMQAQSEMMEESGPAPPPAPPPPDPLSMLLRQAGVMAYLSLEMLNDPKLQQIRQGFWEFHSIGGQYRSAMFTNGRGTISVHGPGGGYSGALLLLWGEDIPAPRKLSIVPVTLQQNDEPPQSLRTFNLGFPSTPGLGTLIFVVPSAQALLDNMEDVHRFTATMGGKVVFSSAWRDGKAARARLAQPSQ